MDVDDGKIEAAVPMDVDEKKPEGPFTEDLEKAHDLETTNPEGALKAYKAIIFSNNEEEEAMKQREEAIYRLGKFLVAQKRGDELVKLNTDVRPFFTSLPKAKTAKIVRSLIEFLAKIEGTDAKQIEMCQECIQWCTKEKRTFLRHRVETRLAFLCLQHKKYNEALDVLANVLREVKKLDDKLLLVEIYIIDCQVHYALENIAKSKAGLTACKTNANAIHCPPLMQAQIDLWSGIVCAREKEYGTSFSYFYESFEALNAAEDPKAKASLKYMLLTKIMANKPQAIDQITNSKSGLKYLGRDVDALKAVAGAHRDRSLKKFEGVLQTYEAELTGDNVIKFHLQDLNDTLMEQNLLRILEPFSRVELNHVAELMELPYDRTHQKLSEMILDKKLNATLDQGIGVLILFDEDHMSSTYDNALKTIKNSSQVLDTLHDKAKVLF